MNEAEVGSGSIYEADGEPGSRERGNISCGRHLLADRLSAADCSVLVSISSATHRLTARYMRTTKPVFSTPCTSPAGVRLMQLARTLDFRGFSVAQFSAKNE